MNLLDERDFFSCFLCVPVYFYACFLSPRSMCMCAVFPFRVSQTQLWLELYNISIVFSCCSFREKKSKKKRRIKNVCHAITHDPRTPFRYISLSLPLSFSLSLSGSLILSSLKRCNRPRPYTIFLFANIRLFLILFDPIADNSKYLFANETMGKGNILCNRQRNFSFRNMAWRFRYGYIFQDAHISVPIALYPYRTKPSLHRSIVVAPKSPFPYTKKKKKIQYPYPIRPDEPNVYGTYYFLITVL